MRSAMPAPAAKLGSVEGRVPAPTRPTSGRVLAIGARLPLPGRRPDEGNWLGRVPTLGREPTLGPVPMLGRLTPVLGRLTDGRLADGWLNDGVRLTLGRE
jgi:hypothetical protein